MNKYQLKRLVKEVIHEVEKIMTEQSATTDVDDKEEKEFTGSDIAMQQAKQLGKEKTVIQLVLRGLKPGKKLKKMLADMAWEAKKADLEVIHAEIEKEGKPVVTMDSPEIEHRFRTKEEEPEEPESPEERLAKIKTGEKAAEWQALTAADLASERKKVAKQRELEKLGQLKKDPTTGLPLDTSLWTDKQWDAWNRGHPEIAIVKSKKYRPSFKKSDIAGKFRGMVPSLGPEKSPEGVFKY
jgi:hypothetical protein